jgi:phospholipase C
MGSPTAPLVREAGSLPFPDKPIGAVNEQMPFDHLVVVMMENHSFDNLLGALSRTRSGVDGLSFDGVGEATNSNPGRGSTPSEVIAFPLVNTAQAKNVSQSWKATHEQINDGAMDGFVTSVNAREPMGYYTPDVLPFAYSLASTFTLADRWFCSVPGPTYPTAVSYSPAPPTVEPSPASARSSIGHPHMARSSTACQTSTSVGVTTSPTCP